MISSGEILYKELQKRFPHENLFKTTWTYLDEGNRNIFHAVVGQVIDKLNGIK